MFSISVVRTDTPEMETVVTDTYIRVKVDGVDVAGEQMTASSKIVGLRRQVAETLSAPSDAYKSVGDHVPIAVVIQLRLREAGQEQGLYLALRRGDVVPPALLDLLHTVETDASRVLFEAVEEQGDTGLDGAYDGFG